MRILSPLLKALTFFTYAAVLIEGGASQGNNTGVIPITLLGNTTLNDSVYPFASVMGGPDTETMSVVSTRLSANLSNEISEIDAMGARVGKSGELETFGEKKVTESNSNSWRPEYLAELDIAKFTKIVWHWNSNTKMPEGVLVWVTVNRSGEKDIDLLRIHVGKVTPDFILIRSAAYDIPIPPLPPKCEPSGNSSYKLYRSLFKLPFIVLQEGKVFMASLSNADAFLKDKYCGTTVEEIVLYEVDYNTLALEDLVRVDNSTFYAGFSSPSLVDVNGKPVLSFFRNDQSVGGQPILFYNNGNGYKEVEGERGLFSLVFDTDATYLPPEDIVISGVSDYPLQPFLLRMDLNTALTKGLYFPTTPYGQDSWVDATQVCANKDRVIEGLPPDAVIYSYGSHYVGGQSHNGSSWDEESKFTIGAVTGETLNDTLCQHTTLVGKIEISGATIQQELVHPNKVVALMTRNDRPHLLPQIKDALKGLILVYMIRDIVSTTTTLITTGTGSMSSSTTANTLTTGISGMSSSTTASPLTTGIGSMNSSSKFETSTSPWLLFLFIALSILLAVVSASAFVYSRRKGSSCSLFRAKNFSRIESSEHSDEEGNIYSERSSSCWSGIIGLFKRDQYQPIPLEEMEVGSPTFD